MNTGDARISRYNPNALKYNPSHAEELIIRRSYRNMARTVGHAFWTCRNAKRRVGEVGEMSAKGKVFLSANKPAVTVSGHIGCWEILSQLALMEGHLMMSVAKDIGTGGMTNMLMKARTSIGQEIVHADGAFRPLMEGLKNGKSLGLLVDQIVKIIISSTMSVGETIPVIKDIFHFTYIRNEGAAFGMLSEHRWVFMIISSVAIVAMCIYLFKFCKERMLTRIGIALVIGGGIGNMIDRIFLGYVVDMIDCRFIDFYIFNVADSCVCVGAGIVFLGVLLDTIKEIKENKAKKLAENNENRDN
jgi:signal peptidase II